MTLLVIITGCMSQRLSFIFEVVKNTFYRYFAPYKINTE